MGGGGQGWSVGIRQGRGRGWAGAWSGGGICHSCLSSKLESPVLVCQCGTENISNEMCFVRLCLCISIYYKIKYFFKYICHGFYSA